MTQEIDELATAREMRDFALTQYRKFTHQEEHRAAQYGNKKGRDEAGERALSASIAFLLATQRIEKLTGTPEIVSTKGPVPAPAHN